MNKNSTLMRVQDNKVFKVVELGHWTDIIADDGERDRVKFLQGDRFSEEYVSQDAGFSYITSAGVVEAPPKEAKVPVVLNELDTFTHMMDTQGISTVAVRDGRIFGFTRTKLQQLMDAIPPDQDRVIILIKSDATSDVVSNKN